MKAQNKSECVPDNGFIETEYCFVEGEKFHSPVDGYFVVASERNDVRMRRIFWAGE